MSPAMLVENKPDVALVCAGVLRARLRDIERGRLRLRIPRCGSRLRPVPGMHYHAAPEMLLQVSCSSSMHLPGQVVTFRAGEICILPRGVAHVETAHGRRAGFHNIVVAYHLRTISFQLNLRPAGGGMRVAAIKHFPAGHVRRISEYLDEVVQAFHGRTPGRSAIMRGALLAHLGILQDVLGGHLAEEEHEDEHFKIMQCRHLVGGNLTDPKLSVRRLATWIQCAPDYLSHLFHSRTGEQLTRYINRHRVEHARYLLDSSNLNISEIARASGYADPSYFTRVYKRFTGESPRQYRRRLGGALRD